MEAVILAAGKGERLGNKEPKPLVKLFDKPLIDHVLDNLKLVGINDVVVVYSNEKVREHLKGREKITFVYNEAIERDNGYSLFKAKRALRDGGFILLMGDHIFDPEILQRLLKVEHGNKNILCVDHDVYEKNIEEATKVLVDDSRIINIGKNINGWNALDTGIFLCDKQVFEVAEGLEKDSNAFTLSKTMRGLAKRGKLFALDVTGMLWMDIDTEEDLRKTMQKSIPLVQLRSAEVMGKRNPDEFLINVFKSSLVSQNPRAFKHGLSLLDIWRGQSSTL